MAFKKRRYVDTSDKRPENLIGNENEILAANISLIQDMVEYTNDQMAELLKISLSQYERIKSGKHSLTADKMMILYYSLGVNLNRLVGDDSHYDFFRKTEDQDTDEVDYRVCISNLMTDIEHTPTNEERKTKVMVAYAAFGEMLGHMFDKVKDKKN